MTKITSLEKANSARAKRAAEKKDYVKALYAADGTLPVQVILDALDSKFGGALTWSEVENLRPEGSEARRMPRKYEGKRAARRTLDSVAKELREVLENMDAPAVVHGDRSSDGTVKVSIRSYQEREV